MTILKQDKNRELCVNLLITSICNAGCSWCIANDFMSSQNSDKKMSRKNMDILLDRLSKERVLQANILGGEPTLHPEAIQFGRDVYQTGNKVGFSTNSLWNESFRKSFDKLDYPLEIEVTYLHKNAYTPKNLEKIMKTFEQLSERGASLGLILENDKTPYKEHLDICNKYSFELRWAIVEPTGKFGITYPYESIENMKNVGRYATQIVKEANDRGIETWADLTVPRCAIKDNNLYLFQKKENDIQFKCPPFFDISPDLKIWRCLPLAPRNLKSLTDFNSFEEAYEYVNQIKKPFLNQGVFKECSNCNHLSTTCSGGSAIAKQIKNGK